MKAQKAVVGLCSACVGVRRFRSGLEDPSFSGHEAGTQAKAAKRTARKQGVVVGVFAILWYQDTGKTKTAYIAV